MATVKKNLYSPGQNLNNQSDNIDLNRVSMDRSFFTVNHGTSPATVTIKVGSLFEVNGAMYAVETDDIVFQMTSTGHFYIAFDGTTYTSHTGKGTFDPAKGGYYQAGNLARTLRWYIDQTAEENYIDMDLDATTESSNGFLSDSGLVASKIILLPEITDDLTARSSTTAASTVETIPGLTWGANLVAGRYYKSVVYYDLTASEQLYISQLVSPGHRGYFKPTDSRVDGGSETPPFPVTGVGFISEYRFRCLTSGVHTIVMRWSSTGSAIRTVDERHAYIEPIEIQEG